MQDQHMGFDQLWHDVIQRIHAQIIDKSWSVRDCRVLLPHPALLQPAVQAWKQRHPNNYIPRFCTLNAWVQESGQWLPGAQEVAFSPYQDAQTARQLLGRVRGAQVQAPWPQWLVKNTYAATSAAAAVPPHVRQAWYDRTKNALFSGTSNPWGATEHMLLQMALAWAGHSRYASDDLWSDLDTMRLGVPQGRAALVIVTGVQPLTLLEKALMSHLGDDQTLHLSLPALQAASDRAAGERTSTSNAADASKQPPFIRVFEALSAHDEASIAAHCVIEHVMAQRTPVALVAIDRQQMRHIQTMLQASGLKLRDETGSLLSTSAGAGRLMALLHACRAQADARDCLHALRAMPTLNPRDVDRLESQARQLRWRSPAQLLLAAESAELGGPQSALVDGLQLLLRFQARMSMRQHAQAWLQCVHEMLSESGLGDWLADSEEGKSLLEQLPMPNAHASEPALNTQDMRWSFADWLGVLRETLEAAAHVPDTPTECDVCILPMHHLPGRNFAAAVLPGCNDQTLPATPKSVGFWSQKQRGFLGLPTQSDAAVTQKTSFESALRWPRVDLVWSSISSEGQARFASPLLQSALQACLTLPPGAKIERCPDPRPRQHLAQRTISAPSPAAAHRLPRRLSATAYSDLRACPYRFFAMRMLGLRAIKAIDEQADARDQGQWLHAVLKHYHERRNSEAWTQVDHRRDLELLKSLAQQVLDEMHQSPQDMWHLWHQKEALFEAYLHWQAQHEAGAHRFQVAETWMERSLGGTVLQGQIDRVDTRTDDGSTLLIDYKLSKSARVKERLSAQADDVQLPFYALLQQGDIGNSSSDKGGNGLAAAYVSLHVKEGVSALPMPHLHSRAQRLAAGISHDMARIGTGSTLPATGLDQACEHCDARGVCRKDDWA
jgi:ATP-dependent helicase/nuclease subunit B